MLLPQKWVISLGFAAREVSRKAWGKEEEGHLVFKVDLWCVGSSSPRKGWSRALFTSQCQNALVPKVESGGPPIYSLKTLLNQITLKFEAGDPYLDPKLFAPLSCAIACVIWLKWKLVCFYCNGYSRIHSMMKTEQKATRNYQSSEREGKFLTMPFLSYKTYYMMHVNLFNGKLFTKRYLKSLSHISNIYRNINKIRNIEKWEKISILRAMLPFQGPYFFNLQFSLCIWNASGRKYTKSPILPNLAK